ncbi:hypothetical protein PVK06_008597 [Gossypium arboreum]|uniref:Uncharacterized protein n=1 Tax=Gossypium arboreum TaxID=29729 RepID=A0ABR0QKA7_GOSAR|nr:hypothetical protein PVK06_008597 [Gossypium arboreum]
MPLRRVNARASDQEDGTSSTPYVLSHRVNPPDESVGPLMEVIIGVFQQIVGANPAPTRANSAHVSRGLPLEHQQLLDELMEKARAIEETLVEPAHSMVVDIGERAFDGASK